MESYVLMNEALLTATSVQSDLTRISGNLSLANLVQDFISYNESVRLKLSPKIMEVYARKLFSSFKGNMQIALTP